MKKRIGSMMLSKQPINQICVASFLPPPANQHSCPPLLISKGAQYFRGQMGWTGGFPFHRGVWWLSCRGTRGSHGQQDSEGVDPELPHYANFGSTRHSVPSTPIPYSGGVFFKPHVEYQGQIKRCFLIFSTSYFRPCIGEPSTSVVENHFFFHLPHVHTLIDLKPTYRKGCHGYLA